MARLARTAVPGYPHHVIHRGNNRQAIFADDLDRARFLELLGGAAREHGVAIHAYVLMDNHVHLLLTPSAERSLSRCMHKLGTSYVGWYNHRHARTGTLWEGRFRSNLIDADSYFLVCIRYIELNPLRACIVNVPDEWRWSSARHHLGHTVDSLITEHPTFWSLGNTPFEREARYREFLLEPFPSEQSRTLTRACLRGRPLGTTAFLARLGHADPPRKRGRPSNL